MIQEDASRSISIEPGRRTAIIDGPLAFATRRLSAARADESGLQVLTLSQLAARLAGGFTCVGTAEVLEPAIQSALTKGGFADLAPVADLPGMVRAVSRALRKVWDSDIDLGRLARTRPATRWSDLALIEASIRTDLPIAARLPRELRDEALRNIGRAPVLLGPVRIEHLSWIAPLWRDLLNRLCAVVPVEWVAASSADTSWFAGTVVNLRERTRPADGIFSCADPHHETVEALRWVRALLSSGQASPPEIAIAAASTEGWDQHFLALARDTGLLLHFSHGVPAVSTRDGQRCAALADVLLRGLTESRIRRLIALCNGEGTTFDQLPDGWLMELPRGATLLTLDDWRRALGRMTFNGAPFQGSAAVLSLLSVLARGTEAATDAGNLFLRTRSRRIWEAALRNAPPQALELTLQTIRLPQDSDPAASVVWCPASHLAASPRPWVRLLGLTSRAWPRCLAEDPILPQHALAGVAFETDPQPEADRRAFAAIFGGAHGSIVLSRGRRSAQGSRQGVSPLLPESQATQTLSRTRIPENAFSEGDRLAARPSDAMALPLIGSATRCWRNWHHSDLTDHDGRFAADHPVIMQALGRAQSATSLRLLLRGPLGFVWKYALGWRAPDEPEWPLTISSDEFGRLVHELLRRAIDLLEAGAGFAAANEVEIDGALRAAAQHVEQAWPLEYPVPPRQLWINTVAHAVQMATAAFKTGETTQADTRSFTEVPFGYQDGAPSTRELPWDASAPVTIPGTNVRVQGSIDRLDLRTVPAAARVTDYKTGHRPNRPELVVIRGGAELQRTLYALACRQLLPEHRVVARLIYLSDPPLEARLDDLDGALAQVSAFVSAVITLLKNGRALPGPDVDLRENDLRLAAPASPSYMRRKGAHFARAGNSISSFWSAR